MTAQSTSLRKRILALFNKGLHRPNKASDEKKNHLYKCFQISGHIINIIIFVEHIFFPDLLTVILFLVVFPSSRHF